MYRTCLWEILVPTLIPGSYSHFTINHHRQWDKMVAKIAGGLTIVKSVKGYWQNESEHMIPVRIACNKKQLAKIMDITAKHYQQKAIMVYKISSEVMIVNY